MKFDEEGHVVWTPRELFALACDDPRRLVSGYFMAGTPWAFNEYSSYCKFLEAIAERTGVHVRNLYLRGSCQIGFSIAPKVDKIWTRMRDDDTPATKQKKSDLDLVIVDASYFQKFEQEVRRWEERNSMPSLKGKLAKKLTKAFLVRLQDRQFNCCRDTALPNAVCVHHQDTMKDVAALEHCGRLRTLSAFVYPDWYSARVRYEYDLNQLCDGVSKGMLAQPSDTSFQYSSIDLTENLALTESVKETVARPTEAPFQ